MKFSTTLFLGLCLALPLGGGETKPRSMTIDDLFRFQRLADPQISPDGKWVVYVVGTVDLKANKIVNNLWIANTEGGDSPCPLTQTTKNDRHPRWSPDSKQVLFESTRSGTSQLWVVDVLPNLSSPGKRNDQRAEPRQLTNISTGAAAGIWSRDGKNIAFVSAVWPGYSTRPFKDSDTLNKKRIDDMEKDPIKARVFTRLFFRHWDEYVEDKRQHLFVLPFTQGQAEPRDVTPWDRDTYPTSSTFSVGDDFTFSPDGKYLVFTAVPARDEAWSTNHDICRVPIEGGPLENLTEKNPAADSAPQYSPDGKWLAYRAQKKAGYEADRWEIMLLPAAGKGEVKSLTAQFEGSADSFLWLPDSDTIYLAAEYRGKTCYFSTRVKNNDGNARMTFINQNTNQALSCSQDGKLFAFSRVAMNHPAEILVGREQNGLCSLRNLSRANTSLLKELELPCPTSINVPGAGGTPVQMWILKPPQFDPAKKWPLAFLVHGGPQGAWDDNWSFRWNAQAWAAQGYVVAMPNPRGSTGFGQQFVDEISGDWGGKCFQDLTACLDYLEKQPWIDPQRMGAAGASFGGYMMNWFQGNTTRFRTLITHCGVFNFESCYATTEELWFDEWEHGGPPWGKFRKSYEKHSPHRLAHKFQTPMLIIHNDLDFRVPVSEGIQLFTTLQRLGIPSRFVNFPDEGHWVLKPQNSAYWHREVFTWLKKYVPPGGR